MSEIKLMMIEDEQNGDDFVENPTWDEVEQAVKNLDGENSSYIGLYKDEEPNNEEFFLVGGGKKFYVCSYFNDGKEYYLLDKNDPEAEDLIEIPIGQINIKPKKYCVSLEDTILPLKYFYQNGRIISDEGWEEV